MACKLITLNDQRIESSSWNDIYNIVKSEEKADAIFDGMLENEFMDWYGEDWTKSGIEPTITNKGIQNMFGTQFKEFQNIPSSINGLTKKLEDFIRNAGVDVKLVDAIKSSLGDNVNAVVNFMDLTLQLVEGRIKENTLPEEAAHIYTKYLQQAEPALYDAMYQKITSYPEYIDVKEQYASEYGDDENLYRMEAIGKVIANSIIKQNKKPDTFIGLAWNRIKAVVKKAFDIESPQFRTIFDIAADEIINSTKHFKIRPSEGRLFQLETGKNKALVDKLLLEDGLLTKAVVRSEKDGQLRETYTRLGKATERVSEWVKRKSRQSKVFTEKEQADNDLKAAFGTKMHEAGDNIVKRYLARATNKSEPSIYTGVSAEYYRSLEKYILNVLDRPEFKNADILTEIQIYDEKRNLAGTIDVLIIDSTGAAHILDYKFITQDTKKLYVKGYNRAEWDEQLKMYRSILSNSYGISQFGMMRMLPFGITYDENIVPTAISINDENIFENAVPSTEERTGNEGLDKIINNLYLEADRIRANQKMLYEDKETRLKAIDNTINNIKVKKDLKAFISMVNGQLKEVEELLKEEGNVSSTDVAKMLHLAEYYSNIDLTLNLPELTTIAGKARNLSIEFKKQLEIWMLSNKIKHPKSEYMKPVTSVLSNVTTMGTIENPVFRYANGLIQDAQDKKFKETSTLEKFFQSLKIDSFDSIIDKTKGLLISEYKKEFYDIVKTADNKWIRENIKIRETVTVNGVKIDAKEDFENRLARKIAQLDKFSPEIKDQEVDKFRRYYDVWSEEYKFRAIAAYNGSHKYIQPNEKWYSEPYKALLANKDSDIYKFYVKIKEITEEANIYSNKRLGARFLPSIEKSNIRKFLDGGFNPVEGAKELLDSFKIHEYDVNDKVRELMINYTGNMDKDKISYELKETFLKFADSVYNVKYMSEIEDDIYLAEQALKNSKFIKVDNIGRVKQDVTGNIITESGEDSKIVTKTVEKFNDFVDNNMYNLKNHSDTEFLGLGVNKVLGGGLSYNSWLKVGLSTLSSSSNLVGGKLNQFIEAAKGRFFTTGELGSAEKSFWTRDPKAMAIIKYFDIATDDNIHKRGRSLRISDLDKQFTSDWIMSMQNVTEKLTQYTTLIAYTKGMTIKDGRIVKKGKDDKSIYDSIVIDKDNVTMPDLTDALYGRARLTVTELNSRLTGAKYDRGKLLYEGDIYLKVLSQFKHWALPMAKERFGTLTYNDNLGLYEEGRATAFLQTVFTKHYAPVAKGFLKALVTFNSRAIVIGAEVALKERYENIIKINPNFDPKFNPEGGLTFPQYQELYHQNIKSFIRELQTWGAILGVSVSYASTDDDDKNKTVAKYLNRYTNEMSYFYSLDSYLSLGGISVPLITTAEEFINFNKEVLANAWGIAANEPELVNPEKIRDKGTKIGIGLRQWDRFSDDFLK